MYQYCLCMNKVVIYGKVNWMWIWNINRRWEINITRCFPFNFKFFFKNTSCGCSFKISNLVTKTLFSLETRMHWLDRRIVRKQLGIMSTYYYVQNQGKLMMQSRENGQKFGQFLMILRSNISKLEILLKNRFHSNWRSYLVLTSGQKPKKSCEPFLRKISKCLILG